MHLHIVSRETLALVDVLMQKHASKLESYVDRLLWWNRKVNLVSRDLTKADVLLHVKHSLFLAPFIETSSVKQWLDTGTGGGLPGIPLAIACSDRNFVLNDVVEKKGVALKDMISDLHLTNANVRIMDVAKVNFDGPFGVISKHAFKIGDLLNRLNGNSWLELLMLKGSDYTIELKEVHGEPITVDAISLEPSLPESFFNGKYLLRICPTPSIALPVV
jgi:16S rRNA (guanine527-N7)-methyltransferase